MGQKSGILLVDKPSGPSSFQVVKCVRRILGAIKAGHLGTLDPFATGLLMVCINEGTKLAPFLIDEKREYEGVIKLGTTTDTFDGTGSVVRREAVPLLDGSALRDIGERFSGEIWQTPPMFSALKHNGVPLYRLARRGQQVKREKRRVTIEGLRLTLKEKDEIFFHAVCSRGAYLRSLAAEIGEVIGCGAHLMSLRRLACGAFRIEDAVQVDAIHDEWNRGRLTILPLRACIHNVGEVTLDEESIQRLVQGEDWVLSQFFKTPKDGDRLKVLDARGRLIALLHGGEGAWKISRVFRRF
jgi:tRNA pseudouridine55 synthase